MLLCVCFQAEDGIRDLVRSRGLGDVYKRQILYNVLIDVPNKERELMTNMTAQVFFVLGSVKDLSLIHI